MAGHSFPHIDLLEQPYRPARVLVLSFKIKIAEHKLENLQTYAWNEWIHSNFGEKNKRQLQHGWEKGLGSIRGYFGLNILGKLNTFV